MNRDEIQEITNYLDFNDLCIVRLICKNWQKHVDSIYANKITGWNQSEISIADVKLTPLQSRIYKHVKTHGKITTSYFEDLQPVIYALAVEKKGFILSDNPEIWNKYLKNKEHKIGVSRVIHKKPTTNKVPFIFDNVNKIKEYNDVEETYSFMKSRLYTSSNEKPVLYSGEGFGGTNSLKDLVSKLSKYSRILILLKTFQSIPIYGQCLKQYFSNHEIYSEMHPIDFNSSENVVLVIDDKQEFINYEPDIISIHLAWLETNFGYQNMFCKKSLKCIHYIQEMNVSVYYILLFQEEFHKDIDYLYLGYTYKFIKENPMFLDKKFINYIKYYM